MSRSINLSGHLCVKQTLRPHQAAETELTSQKLPRMFGCMRVWDACSEPLAPHMMT